jgi:hypothetical protein
MVLAFRSLWGLLAAGALWAQPYVISTVAGGAHRAAPGRAGPPNLHYDD